MFPYSKAMNSKMDYNEKRREWEKGKDREEH